jgi:hypothetical protein
VGDGTSDEDWMGIGKNDKDSMTAVDGTSFDLVCSDTIRQKHSGALESTEEVTLPFKTLAQVESQEIIIKDKKRHEDHQGEVHRQPEQK